jgi:hypothetical protein
MEAAKQPTNNNDFAVAKALNALAGQMILCVVMAEVVGLPEDHDIHDLNRSYVLLTDELQKLYDGNPKLSEIKPEPVWKRFDVLRTSSWDINRYLEDADNDAGNAHNARVEKLCIIAGKETPDYTPEQKKLVNDVDETISKYTEMITAANNARLAKKENDWQIPEYSLMYKPDGSILINNVLKLKKAHAGSTTERLLEQAVKRPHELFKPDLGQTARNISTVLNSAGFTPILRQLFFPTVSKSKGIIFRDIVTRKQADDEKIDTAELDLKLKELGASIEPKT